MSLERIKCVIMGSGPAGYTAAIYTGRANLNPVLYEGMLTGGQLTTTTDIENFPGYPDGITGPEMMEDFRRQALKFGVDIRRGIITEVDLKSYPFILTVDNDKKIEADSLIVATGATARYLGLPSERKYVGLGVSACATCDGFFYRGQDVAIVGGGDTACEDANYLSNICNKVYMIVRKPHLRASHIMQKRIKENPKIEILFEHVTKEILGDENGVNGLMVEKADGSQVRLDVTGLFLAIGHHPNTRVFEGKLELNDEGYIKTVGHTSHTSVKGIFAAGDVRDPSYRQAVVAAGSGCMAALDCERFLMLAGELSPEMPPLQLASTDVPPPFNSNV